MACKTKTMRTTLCAFSDGTQTALYHSVFRVPVADWAKARLSFFVEGNSGLETVSGAAAYGDKEADFHAPTVIDFPSGASQSLNGDGSVYGSSYGTLDTSRQFVDFGVKCKNQVGGSKMEHAHVTFVLDLSE